MLVYYNNSYGSVLNIYYSYGSSDTLVSMWYIDNKGIVVLPKWKYVYDVMMGTTKFIFFN